MGRLCTDHTAGGAASYLYPYGIYHFSGMRGLVDFIESCPTNSMRPRKKFRAALFFTAVISAISFSFDGGVLHIYWVRCMSSVCVMGQS